MNAAPSDGALRGELLVHECRAVGRRTGDLHYLSVVEILNNDAQLRRGHLLGHNREDCADFLQHIHNAVHLCYRLLVFNGDLATGCCDGRDSNAGGHQPVRDCRFFALGADHSRSEERYEKRKTQPGCPRYFETSTHFPHDLS